MLLSRIQLCLLYMSHFSITVWKAVEMKNVFVLEILFKVFLYLNTLVGKAFVFLKDKCICICIEIHFHVFDPMSGTCSHG